MHSSKLLLWNVSASSKWMPGRSVVANAPFSVELMTNRYSVLPGNVIVATGLFSSSYTTVKPCRECRVAFKISAILFFISAVSPAKSIPSFLTKGLSMNNVCTLARAPGGQMQGAATQAMWCHRRGAATQQMPARRRAPLGCGPQARWLCCSLLAYYPVCSSLAPRQRAWGPAAKCKRYSLTDPNLGNVPLKA